MKLHRTSGKPDWADLKPSRMNLWQACAYRSNGIITPGNIVSLIGFGLVLYGLVSIHAHDYKTGLLFLLIGRFADLLDGLVADKTQTKSPLGETIDASIDKIGTLLTFIIMYASHSAPWALLTILLLPQTANALLSAKAYKLDKRLHPSVVGKLSMAALLVSILGFLVLKTFAANNLEIYAVDAVAIGSSLLGFISSYGYAKQSLK